MADLVKRVDAGNSSGTDYTSLQSWNDAWGGLPSPGACVSATTRCIADWINTNGSAEGGTDIDGWGATNALYHPYIRVASAYQFIDAFPTAGNFVRIASTTRSSINVITPHTHIEGLACQRVSATAGNVMQFRTVDGLVIMNCLGTGGGATGTAFFQGIALENIPGTAVLINCGAYCYDSSNMKGFRFPSIAASSDILAYNCVAVCTNPFDYYSTANVNTFINCVAWTKNGTVAGFSGTAAIASACFNNAANVGTPPGASSIALAGSADTHFASSGVFNLRTAGVGSGLHDAGKNLYADARYAVTVDYRGSPRPSAGGFDLGWNELKELVGAAAIPGIGGAGTFQKVRELVGAGVIPSLTAAAAFGVTSAPSTAAAAAAPMGVEIWLPRHEGGAEKKKRGQRMERWAGRQKTTFW